VPVGFSGSLVQLLVLRIGEYSSVMTVRLLFTPIDSRLFGRGLNMNTTVKNGIVAQYAVGCAH
jgi:hypothetical protein